MTDEEGGYGDHFNRDELTPRGEGETWAETAERLRPDATVDLSCPNGCFELEVTAHHKLGDADALIDRAVQDEPGPCPNCGADLRGENDAN